MIDPSERKTCEQCGNQFGPNLNRLGDLGSWRRRRTCGKVCAMAATQLARSLSDLSIIGDRVLLAKTCPECGVFFQAAHFPRVTRCKNLRKRQCVQCVTTSSAQLNIARNKASAHRVNHRKGWTEGEVEIANRKDLTSVEAASILQRSIASVQQRRQDTRYDVVEVRRRANLKTQGGRAHGNQWTGPEMEIASRHDLTLTQIAKILGRTMCAVQGIRYRMKHDPKTTQVVGLARSAQLQPERRTA